MALTWDEIAKAQAKFERVEVPELGEAIVWQMSAAKRVAWDAFVLEHKDDPDMGGKAAIWSVAACLGDESGPFGRSYDEIAALPAPIVDRLGNVAGRINLLTNAAAEEARGN